MTCAKQPLPELPSFFMNSVPKSGTNLLLQLLVGLPDVTHNPTDTFFDPTDFQGSFYRLGKIPQRQFGVGHIYYSQEWSDLLKRLRMKNIFLYRDLRDVVVSMSHFVVEKPQFHRMHRLREYLLTEKTTEKERVMALIQGIRTKEIQYPSISEWFLPFWKWTQDDNTLSLTFEDLIRNENSNRITLERVIEFLWEGKTKQLPVEEMIDAMRKSMNPSTSGTFRTGKIGTWKEEFDEEMKAAFKVEAGELLIMMGYEQSRNW